MSESAEQHIVESIDGELVYLVAEDLKAAASLLYQTYYDDDVFRRIFRAEKADYDKRLRAAIREDLNAFWESGQPLVGVRDGDTLLGVACLTKPGENFGPGRFWHWRISMLMTAGFLSTKQVLEKERRIQQAMPDVPYHMLAFIAVSPQYQHHGLGQLLVKAVDTILQEDPNSHGVGVYVTRNDYRDFFVKRGYQSIATIEIAELPGELLFHQRDKND
ncbi:GNAT family N-acetyltransferase [Idiomarina seosinensis]|uniref:GNAT family N-acetyltransferase n=1 Tax=Idiomarina seosinensis TaxID=281739 RepID=A0A432ZHD2_9GAMM|nr:GNAT family N-acetyltransferase [Idiomarina seosinensis]RUO77313.1 GNAT family N-acetyltransferase [Idiomarina seosinensis]